MGNHRASFAPRDHPIYLSACPIWHLVQIYFCIVSIVK